MRCLVVYSSVTGNTKSVAEAVVQAMPRGTEMVPVHKAPPPAGYDFLALGFWVHRAMPDPRMLRYMRGVRGTTVGLFGTLAAYPDSPHAGKVEAAARALMLMESNEIAGCFLCQGRLAPKRFAARMVGTDKTGGNHPMTPERRARLIEAASHPDERDFANAREACASWLRDFRARF